MKKLSEKQIEQAYQSFIKNNNIEGNYNEDIIKKALAYGSDLVYYLYKLDFETMLNEMYESYLNEEAIKEGEKNAN